MLLTEKQMNKICNFINYLNYVAVLTKTIRRFEECSHSNTNELISFPDDCSIYDFDVAMNMNDGSHLPSVLADIISALYMSPSADRQYILKLLVEKLDLEYDTNYEYPQFRNYIRTSDYDNSSTNIETFMKEMPILRKRIELTFGVDIYAKKDAREGLSSNFVSEAFLRKVYNIVNGDAFADISFNEFERCVAERDFSKIYNSKVVRCTKVKYVIYTISRAAGKEWYIDAAHSINTEPQKCSGATVPKLWRKKLDSIRV